MAKTAELKDAKESKGKRKPTRDLIVEWACSRLPMAYLHDMFRSLLDRGGIEAVHEARDEIFRRNPRIAGQVRLAMPRYESMARVRAAEAEAAKHPPQTPLAKLEAEEAAREQMGAEERMAYEAGYAVVEQDGGGFAVAAEGMFCGVDTIAETLPVVDPLPTRGAAVAKAVQLAGVKL